MIWNDLWPVWGPIGTLLLTPNMKFIHQSVIFDKFKLKVQFELSPSYIYIWGTVHRNMHLNWKKACTSFPCIPHKQGHFLWIFLYDMEDNRLALNFYLKKSIFMFSVLTFYIAILWLYRYILLLFLLKEFFGSVFFNDHNPCYFFDQGSQSHQYKWSKLERKCQEFTYTP